MVSRFSAAPTPQRGGTMRNRFAIITGLAAAALGVLVAAPAHAADPVDFGSSASHVYDETSAGVLSPAEEDDVEDALGQLADDSDVSLWVVYVDTFDNPGDGTQWSQQTADLNGFGSNNYLLSVAVEQRNYALTTPPNNSITEAQGNNILAAIEQELGGDQWAGAAIAAADAFADARAGGDGTASSGGSSGGSLFTVVMVVVIGGAVIFLIVWAVRRSKKSAQKTVAAQRPRDPYEGVSTEELHSRAASALIETDDRIRTAGQELGFAEAEFGEGAVGEFRDAISEAKAHLGSAFEASRALEASEKPSDDDTRAAHAAVLQHCESAHAVLDEKGEAFEELRTIAEDVPAAIESVRAQAQAARGADGRIAEAVSRLQQTYGPEALESIVDNAEQAKEMLALADDQLAEAQQLIASGDTGEAAAAVHTAESAADQAAQLERSVRTLAETLQNAERQATVLIAELEADLARARTTGARQAAGAITATEQAVRTAQANLAGTGKLPRTMLEQLQQANQQIDTVIQNAQRARHVLDQTLMQAHATIDSVEDFVSQRRGAIGADARTRLAEAQSDLSRAESMREVDAAQAQQLAQRALQLAQDALRRAKNDVSGFGGGYGGGHYGGRRGGVDIGSAVLGGVIGGLLGGGGGRRGGGFGGGGFGGGFGGGGGSFGGGGFGGGGGRF
ncbi:TPM domain-containing protein [Microbacterium sp. JB110]|uniref:TPM domain-containing protein n=1 Tax=Microbacterium sp. JB110 TaxID=2024477 RepID=UPI00097F0B33|nr:TPM domain-containing protein [Microbacterium sp. JB110]SJM67637.1 Beta-propeller domains of methanol dehydrogenase type [Frigoribacterium sp. JB110]